MSLTEAAIFFRKFFRVALITLLAIVAIWAMWGVIVAGFRMIFPAEETPTVLFGKIPPPKLPSNPSNSLGFILDTASGGLPVLPKVLPVYQFIDPQPNVLDSDRAAKLAADFGFGSPQQIDSQTFRYTDPNHPSQEMRIDIVTKNFTIANANFSDPTVQKTSPEGSGDEIVKSARDILDRRNLLASDLEGSKASTRYLKISGNALARASSISESNFARVDIFRSNIKNYPIVTPSFADSLVYLTLSGGRAQDNLVVEGGFTYWAYDANPNSTYPLRSPASAWDQLKQGQGSLITPLVPNFTQTRIKNISLAYFEGSVFQDFLQPIYLFTGVGLAQDGSEVQVVLYLPAVDPGYLSE